jgi:hypothetical protein
LAPLSFLTPSIFHTFLFLCLPFPSALASSHRLTHTHKKSRFRSSSWYPFLYHSLFPLLRLAPFSLAKVAIWSPLFLSTT